VTADPYAISSLDEPPPLELVALPAETDPWLQRRALGFGASDTAVLLAALGRRPLDWLPSYLQADAKVTNRTHKVPRLIAQKAGVIEPRKRGSAVAQGTAREVELLDTWRELALRDQAGPIARLIDAGSVMHSSKLPRAWWPLPDRHCPQLLASLDAWGADALFGDDVVIECKCSVRPYTGTQAHHVVQLHAQMAVTGATLAAVIEGCGWAAEWTGGSGPVRTWGDGYDALIERNDALIAEIRECAEEGWAMVTKLRAEVAT
jgi:hypothetical protein